MVERPLTNQEVVVGAGNISQRVFPVSISTLIELLKSPRGGWTRDNLKILGVPWPPPHGWKRELEKQDRQVLLTVVDDFLGRSIQAGTTALRIRECAESFGQDAGTRYSVPYNTSSSRLKLNKLQDSSY